MNARTEPFDRRTCEMGNDYLQALKARMAWWITMLAWEARTVSGRTVLPPGENYPVWEDNDGGKWNVFVPSRAGANHKITDVIYATKDHPRMCHFYCDPESPRHGFTFLLDKDILFIDSRFQGFIDGMIAAMPELRDAIRPYEEAAKQAARAHGTY